MRSSEVTNFLKNRSAFELFIREIELRSFLSEDESSVHLLLLSDYLSLISIGTLEHIHVERTARYCRTKF